MDELTARLTNVRIGEAAAQQVIDLTNIDDSTGSGEEPSPTMSMTTDDMPADAGTGDLEMKEDPESVSRPPADHASSAQAASEDAQDTKLKQLLNNCHLLVLMGLLETFQRFIMDRNILIEVLSSETPRFHRMNDLVDGRSYDQVLAENDKEGQEYIFKGIRDVVEDCLRDMGKACPRLAAHTGWTQLNSMQLLERDMETLGMGKKDALIHKIIAHAKHDETVLPHCSKGNVPKRPPLQRTSPSASSMSRASPSWLNRGSARSRHSPQVLAKLQALKRQIPGFRATKAFLRQLPETISPHEVEDHVLQYMDSRIVRGGKLQGGMREAFIDIVDDHAKLQRLLASLGATPRALLAQIFPRLKPVPSMSRWPAIQALGDEPGAEGLGIVHVPLPATGPPSLTALREFAAGWPSAKFLVAWEANPDQQALARSAHYGHVFVSQGGQEVQLPMFDEDDMEEDSDGEDNDDEAVGGDEKASQISRLSQTSKASRASRASQASQTSRVSRASKVEQETCGTQCVQQLQATIMVLEREVESLQQELRSVKSSHEENRRTMLTLARKLQQLEGLKASTA